MKSAVCVLIQDAKNPSNFLAVSRRNSPTLWGLPGGKVDPGEFTLQSAIRELQEEAGLTFSDTALEPLFCAVCHGKAAADTYWVTTYVYTGNPVEESHWSPEAGLHLAWASEEFLSSAQNSPFSGYNEKVFEAFRQYRQSPEAIQAKLDSQAIA